MSRADKKDLMPTKEELFVENIVSQPQGKWKIGKRFIVADQKAFILLKNEQGSDITLPEGSILTFAGVSIANDAGGNQSRVIKFSDESGENHYAFNTKKTPSDCNETFSALDIPALIDLDMIKVADSLLRKQPLWIRTQLWYDDEGNTRKGKKFVPVEIVKVSPGNMYFPIKIRFKIAEDNNEASIYMNVRATSGIGAESRTFPSLFFLSDPRQKYPSISDEIWDLIKEGSVKTGMTKEECRLSLGSPSDVDSGHDWNNTLDVWRYKDGTFLQFQDGLLVNFRH